MPKSGSESISDQVVHFFSLLGGVKMLKIFSSSKSLRSSSLYRRSTLPCQGKKAKKNPSSGKAVNCPTTLTSSPAQQLQLSVTSASQRDDGTAARSPPRREITG